MLNFITQHRRGTTQEWENSKDIPRAGEFIIEERLNEASKIKLGDGIHSFEDLNYIDDDTVVKLNNLLQRYNQHVAYIESENYIPDSTIATEVLDARTIDGVTYNCLGETLQAIANKNNGGLVYDLNGEVGLHQPYYLYLTDKYGNILEDTGVQIISGSGGGGGSASSSVLKIERITPDPYIITVNDNPVISFIFSGVDSSGESIAQANATWKVDGIEVLRTFVSGDVVTNADYLKEYLDVGSHKVLLLISDDAGSSVTKTWNVNIVDIRIESDFDSSQKFDTEHDITFTYTPYGALDKEVHFILDGVKLLPITRTTVSGTPLVKKIPAKDHGSHYLEVYITAELENVPGEPPILIESNHIFKDLIVYDDKDTSVDPVIGCDIKQFTCKEYDTVNIAYAVYASVESPTVIISVTDSDGTENIVATPQITSPKNVYSFRSSQKGNYTINIKCGNTSKQIFAVVEKLDIPVEPVTEGLVFDFNPVGKNNDYADRLWTNGTVSMTVSDNFDWVNGGYKQDELENVCFIVKSGTWAEFDYTELFADDTKKSGREFKVVFKTANIKKRDTSIITCRKYNADEQKYEGIGLDMRVENANIYSSVDHLYTPYCEEDIIEFEYNISNNIPLILTYEDGVANTPLIYSEASTLTQGRDAQPIRVGSEDCDVYIYRMKAYSTSLTDRDILSNFIMDARTSDEIVNRFKRNQIYDDNTKLDPIVLAEKCPDLRIIMIEAPRFTYDKDDKVSDTTIRMIYQNGRKNEDNWICTGAQHSGQGTSSNEYGYSGRNLDLIMNTDSAKFTLADGTTASTITLTDNSVPVNYLNVKVNIASSENANNAQMARRYNKYNPFERLAKLKNPKVKDTMEFYNCVVFIKETGPVNTHTEFKDDKWHFYAIGNVGDSKKTDKTRVNDKNDPKECIIEILDWNLPLSSFPTGKDGICSIEEWNETNVAYQSLYAPYKYKDGKFKSFGNGSYEFRYEKKEITEEEREVNINAWRDFYRFVVTSTNEEFIDHFEDYFVLDSALYYYLFTERYTMVDNRAKNSFWHYGKVYFTPEQANNIPGLDAKYIDSDKAIINDGYRWDLCFGYDFDTSLGIDNVGKLRIPYGKEDIDYYDDDPKKGYIYRAANSTFFTRVRDNFRPQMESMYLDRESEGAWSCTELINQWDNAQNEFPEELWRLDIERKYIRTYLGSSIDNCLEGEATSRFLTEMLNGRKRYQRRMFERNQELYMATKYFGNLATANNIFIRLNNPENYTDEFKPEFKFYLTPYSDMYIGVSFAAGTTPIHFRAKQGNIYYVESPLDEGDITLIYGAKSIQAISSLAKCYVGDNDFSKATRLQSIILGDEDSDYTNTFLSALSLLSNPLLENLNVSNLATLETLDLSKCFNLKHLSAEGSGCKSIKFATSGLVETFTLPAVTTLILRKLYNIKDYQVSSSNIQEVIIEDTPSFDSKYFIESANNLNRVRLTNIDWTLSEPNPLVKLVDLYGFTNDDDPQPQDKSVVTGSAHINSATGADYKTLTEAYKELTLTFDSLTSKVYFKDEEENLLDEKTVYNPELAGTPVNPKGVTLKDIPNIKVDKSDSEDGQYSYTQSGWTTMKGSDIEDTDVFNNILGDRTVYPRYIETVKNYTLSFYTGTKLIYQEVLPYGSPIEYDPIKAIDANKDQINSIIDSKGNPLKQDTASPFMYKYVAFLPNIGILTRDTSLYADFVLSLDDIYPAVLSEFEYTRNDANKTLSLNKYVAVSGDSEEHDSDSITYIPEKYDVVDTVPLGEYTVVSVGGFNPDLEDVSVDVEIVQLPDTLETIQDEAFLNCKKLLKADIPVNVTYLGKNAFSKCSSIEEVSLRAKNIQSTISSISESPFTGSNSEKGFVLTIDDAVETIPSNMFAQSDSRTMISQITWGNNSSCETIESNAFRKSTPKNMIVPDSVKHIKASAFQGNSHHTRIDTKDTSYGSFKISNNLKTLGEGAFDEWSNLTSIRLPNTLTTIDGAFARYCPNLSTIEIEEGSSRYVVSSNCVVDTINRSVIQGCSTSKLLGGDNGIKRIADRAFEGSGIKTPDKYLLPDSLENIGSYAFTRCDGITQIKIPSNVKSLPTQCFQYCTNLENIEFHDNVTQLGTYLFWACSKLNNVILPAGLTRLPGGCFIDCVSLENIQFSKSLTGIDVDAFKNTAVKNIVLPDSLTQLSTSAFSKCVHLETVTFGKGIKVIGGSITSTTSETTPFIGCTKLSQINCPFSADHDLAKTAPWGAPNKVRVTYNFGSDNEVSVEYN